jgi:GNAT superfamily N-acetyltransferase
MIVTTPTVTEFPAIAELGRRMWAESKYAAVGEYDAEACMDFGWFLLNNDIGFFVVAKASEDTEPVGMFLGQLVPYFFAPSKLQATDNVVYVAPEHRGSTAFLRMLRAFERWAEDKGVFELVVGVSTRVNAERTGALYQKMGYTHIGGIFNKRIGQTEGHYGQTFCTS